MGLERTDELYKVLLGKGYPKELCAEIAYKNLSTDYTATRMLGYLYRYTEPRLEDVIDEMIVILRDREEIIKKKEFRWIQLDGGKYRISKKSFDDWLDNQPE